MNPHACPGCGSIRSHEVPFGSGVVRCVNCDLILFTPAEHTEGFFAGWRWWDTVLYVAVFIGLAIIALCTS